MVQTTLFTLFPKNLQVQRAFKTEQFSLLPLPTPQAVTCYYFRNKSGLFYGAFQPYLTGSVDDIALDHTNYWEEWEQHLPHFQMIDVDASNPIMLLFEPAVQKIIAALCQQTYT